MTRTRIVFSFLGLFLYLFFVLAVIPAGWAMRAFFPGIERNGLLVTGASGTLWSGTATVLFHDQEGVPGELGRLAWRVAPSFLLSGRLGFRVSLDGAALDLKGEIGCGPAGVRLRDLTAEIDLRGLTRLYLPAGLFSPSGVIMMATSEFSVQPNKMVGEGKIVWKDASVAGGMGQGDYELRLAGDANAVILKVHTLRGELLVDMQGQLLVAERQFWVSGTVQPGRAGDSRLLAALMGANNVGGIPKRQIPLPPWFFDVLSAAHCR